MNGLTYDEATEEIKKLSSKYQTKLDENQSFEVIYKGVLVALVDGHTTYEFYTGVPDFGKLLFSNKLYMLLAELSMTPIDKRGLVHKWSVPICKTPSYKVVWSKVKVPTRGAGLCSTSEESFSLATLFNYTGKSTGTKDDYIFTDSEYNELLDYLHTLPDGGYQIEMAERGKVEAFI